MQEYLSLMGIGYNYLLPEGYQFEFPCPDHLQGFYEIEAEKRARELVEKDKLDAWEMTLYKNGECSYEEVYELSHKQAREDICEKLYERRFDYVD